MPVRLALQKSQTNLEITHDEDAKNWEIVFKQVADLIKFELKFEVGAEFDEKLPFGVGTNKSVAALDGDKLKVTSKTPKGELVRTFSVKEDGKELEIVSQFVNRICSA